MSHARGAARDHLFPNQLAVAVPAGAEVAVHTVRGWLDRHSRTLARRSLNSTLRMRLTASAANKCS